jgi:D-arabinose 1-dehydrogenase-like Zn-dependent alcohol dehydrogenase
VSEPEFLSPEYYQQQFKDLKRLTKILNKLRAAGICEKDIHFLSEFWQKDLTHVQKVIELGKQEERRQAEQN